MSLLEKSYRNKVVRKKYIKIHFQNLSFPFVYILGDRKCKPLER